jgi:ribosomal protein S18 acetylase RimI-like enzyme
MSGTGPIEVRPIREGDAKWLRDLLEDRWGGQTQVADGREYRPSDLPGVVATMGGERVGYAALEVDGAVAWIGLIDVQRPRSGIGTRLVAALRDEAFARGCTTLRAITTNDNDVAQRFYEAQGFRLRQVRAGAVNESRRIKPTISLTGVGGVPMTDELEYELTLS